MASNISPRLHSYKLSASFSGKTVTHIALESNLERKQRRIEVQTVWTTEQRIGAGAFGVVWRQRSDNGQLRAVKIVARAQLNIQEVEALIELNDRTDLFIRFLGWFEDIDRDAIHIAMEFIEHGDLGKYIVEYGTKVEAKQITTQILEGLVVLHERKICHRDLKPQNILVASLSPIWVKITDFGIAKHWAGTSLKTHCGTAVYRSPEQLGFLPRQFRGASNSYTNHIDIWALGVIVHEMLTLEIPFLDTYVNSDSGLTSCLSEPEAGAVVDTSLLYGYCQGTNPFPCTSLRSHGVSEDGIEFVKNLMVVDPRKRLSAAQALASAWCVFNDPIALSGSPPRPETPLTKERQVSSKDRVPEANPDPHPSPRNSKVAGTLESGNRTKFTGDRTPEAPVATPIYDTVDLNSFDHRRSTAEESLVVSDLDPWSVATHDNPVTGPGETVTQNRLEQIQTVTSGLVPISPDQVSSAEEAKQSQPAKRVQKSLPDLPNENDFASTPPQVGVEVDTRWGISRDTATNLDLPDKQTPVSPSMSQARKRTHFSRPRLPTHVTDPEDEEEDTRWGISRATPAVYDHPAKQKPVSPSMSQARKRTQFSRPRLPTHVTGPENEEEDTRWGISRATPAVYDHPAKQKPVSPSMSQSGTPSHVLKQGLPIHVSDFEDDEADTRWGIRRATPAVYDNPAKQKPVAPSRSQSGTPSHVLKQGLPIHVSDFEEDEADEADTRWGIRRATPAVSDNPAKHTLAAPSIAYTGKHDPSYRRVPSGPLRASMGDEVDTRWGRAGVTGPDYDYSKEFFLDGPPGSKRGEIVGTKSQMPGRGESRDALTASTTHRQPEPGTYKPSSAPLPPTNTTPTLGAAGGLSSRAQGVAGRSRNELQNDDRSELHQPYDLTRQRGRYGEMLSMRSPDRPVTKPAIQSAGRSSDEYTDIPPIEMYQQYDASQVRGRYGEVVSIRSKDTPITVPAIQSGMAQFCETRDPWDEEEQELPPRPSISYDEFVGGSQGPPQPYSLSPPSRYYQDELYAVEQHMDPPGSQATYNPGAGTTSNATHRIAGVRRSNAGIMDRDQQKGWTGRVSGWFNKLAK